MQKKAVPKMACSWLSKSFLEDALRKFRDDNTLCVSSVDLGKYSSGDGYTSVMCRLTLILKASQDGKEHSHALICKFLSPSCQFADSILQAGTFERESSVYKVLDLFTQCLDIAATGKFKPFGPKFYLYGSHPTPFLLMEDLNASGFKLADRHERLDFAHSHLVMKSIARFHATSFLVSKKNEGVFEQFNECILFDKKADNFMQKMMTNSLIKVAKIVESWGDEYFKHAKKLMQYSNTIFNELAKLEQIKKHGKLKLLLHGDLWLNNMMFKYDNGSVSDLRFVDFQVAFTSSTPALDLHYFLYTSVKDIVRQNYKQQLICEYHKTFVETLNILGCNEILLTLEQLEKDMAETALHSVYSSLVILPLILSTNIAVDVGMDENDTSIYLNPVFINSLKLLLVEFEANGIL